jgi:uncharacterized membrane protein YgcG
MRALTDIKIMLSALTSLPFFADIVAAADRLNDAQMDMVTAGQTLGIECPGCGDVSMSSASMSVNGVTTNTSSSTGGSSGSGSSSGSTGSGGGGSSGPSLPGLVTVQVPANLTAVINTALTRTVVSP